MVISQFLVASALSSSILPPPKAHQPQGQNIPAGLNVVSTRRFPTAAKTYRLWIAGFKVEHPHHDGLLDAGDTVFVHVDEFRFNAQDSESHVVMDSDTFGWSGTGRTKFVAGKRKGDGGFKDNDGLPDRVDDATRQLVVTSGGLPLPIVTETITPGSQAILLIPTIWRIDGKDPGETRRGVVSWVAQRDEAAIRTARSVIQRTSSYEVLSTNGSLEVARGKPYALWDAGPGDYPYGMNWPTGPQRKLRYFTPTALVLTSEMLDGVLAGRNLPNASVFFGCTSPGLMYFHYEDSDNKAAATVYIRVEQRN
jgi:hypothetical protein